MKHVPRKVAAERGGPGTLRVDAALGMARRDAVGGHRWAGGRVEVGAQQLPKRYQARAAARGAAVGGDGCAGCACEVTLVGLPGFEPGTSASRTQRANQTALQPVAGAARGTAILDEPGAPHPAARARRDRHGYSATVGAWTARRATISVIRRRSIDCTRSSHPSTSTASPGSGIRSSRSRTYPLMVT